MKKTYNKILITIALTFAATMFVFAANTAKPIENKMFFQFPMTIEDWSGREIQMQDYVYQMIETKYLFLRDYQSQRYSVPLNLSIVWFDDTDIAFHAPEACLGGVGNKVKEKTTIKARINGMEQTLGKLILDQPDKRKTIVLYYFDVDGYRTTSQTEIRLHILLKRLFFERSSASFIRLIAPVVTSDENTVVMMLDFLKGAQGIIPDYLYTDHVT